jgi:proteic killer suppression protein
MIASFADRNAEAVFQRRHAKRIDPSLTRTAYRKLMMLDAAEVLDDLRSPPGNRLEALRGDRLGQHSIRINDQWRVVFTWRNGQAHDVQIVDYH